MFGEIVPPGGATPQMFANEGNGATARYKRGLSGGEVGRVREEVRAGRQLITELEKGVGLGIASHHDYKFTT